MGNRTLLIVGGVGAAVTALCCFTPLLVIVLGALGLSAWFGWLDYALFPLLAVFLAIVVLALIRMRRR